MDINNYSYTPYILDTEEQDDENHFSSDDIEVSIEYTGSPSNYWVTAFSYDGQMNIDECFKLEDNAKELFNHIKDNYSSTVPNKRELNKFIYKLHNREKGYKQIVCTQKQYETIKNALEYFTSLPYWDIEEEALKEVKQALKAVQEATN